MKHTYKERLEAGLTALGYVYDMLDRSKYSAWTKGLPIDKGELKLFIGNAGALRKGECASRSFSVGDPSNQSPIFKHILDAGDKALATKEEKTFAGF